MSSYWDVQQKPEAYMTYKDYNNIYIDYENVSKSQKTNELLLLSAKAHFIKEEYIKCIEILKEVPMGYNTKILYERQTLMFKSVYLSETDNPDMNALQRIINDYEGFKKRCPGKMLTKFHDNSVKELMEIVERGNKMKIKNQKVNAQEIKEEIKKLQNKKPYEGMPCYLISDHWNRDFLNFIQSSSPVPQVNLKFPPPMTNFELMNHIFELEPHEHPHNSYLNKIMFPLQEEKNYHVIGREHWLLLMNIFGGNEMKRFYNISNNRKVAGGDNVLRVFVYYNKIPYVIQYQNNSFYERSVLPMLIEKFGFGQLKEETRNGDYRIVQLGRIEQQICNRLKFVTVDPDVIQTVGYAEENRKKKILELYDLEKYDGIACEKGNTVGLANLGNTCYMNSALQFLSNLKVLSNYFLQNRYLPKLNLSSTNKDGSYGYLTCSYADLLKRLWSESENLTNLKTNNYSYIRSRSVDPTLFKNTFSNRYSDFEGYDQQDAQEFLMFLLNCLHDDLNEKSQVSFHVRESTSGKELRVVKQTSINYYNKHNKSIISDLFHGFHNEEIRCEECGYKSLRFEDNLMIHIQVPECSDAKIPIYLVCYNDMKKAEKYEIYIKKRVHLKDLLKDIKEYKNSVMEFVPYIFVDRESSECREISEDYLIKDLMKELERDRNLFVYEIPECGEGEVRVVVYYWVNDLGCDVQDGFNRILILDRELLLEEKEEELLEYINRETCNKMNNEISYIFTKEVKSKMFDYFVNVYFKSKQLNYTNNNTNMVIGNVSDEDVLTLVGCLDKMTKEEKIEGWFCEKCKFVRNAFKTDKIYSTGKYLAIQLKRFTERGKITTKIEYPLEGLNMRDYVDAEVYKPNEFVYNLQSVIVHSGSLNSGHYTCIIRKHGVVNRKYQNNVDESVGYGDSEWLRYDDEIVTEIDVKYVVDENAYILLYEMVDGVDMYISGMNKV